MPLDIGIEIVRPYAEALVFQHGEIALLSRFSSRRRQGGLKQHRAVAVALTGATTQASAATLLERVMDEIAPRMEFDSATSALAKAIGDQPAQAAPLEAAIAWCDGTLIRITFAGHYRMVSIHEGVAQRVQSPTPDPVGSIDLPAQPGDWLILAAPATDAVLPLGQIAALTLTHAHPNQACRIAAGEAAAVDPLSHHAVAAIRIAGDQDP
jgi:hypothetical protein